MNQLFNSFWGIIETSDDTMVSEKYIIQTISHPSRQMI